MQLSELEALQQEWKQTWTKKIHGFKFTYSELDNLSDNPEYMIETYAKLQGVPRNHTCDKYSSKLVQFERHISAEAYTFEKRAGGDIAQRMAHDISETIDHAIANKQCECDITLPFVDTIYSGKISGFMLVLEDRLKPSLLDFLLGRPKFKRWRYYDISMIVRTCSINYLSSPEDRCSLHITLKKK